MLSSFLRLEDEIILHHDDLVSIIHISLSDAVGILGLCKWDETSAISGMLSITLDLSSYACIFRWRGIIMGLYISVSGLCGVFGFNDQYLGF